jgi:putative hydrolase
MLKIDLHIHTIYSGHALNTMLECINRAKELKMKVIGFSDHGPSQSGCLVNESYLNTLHRIPQTVNGMRILHGIEANIIDKNGFLDVPDKIISEKLDYVMAAIHPNNVYKDLGVKGNTEATKRAVESGKVDILTHPYLCLLPIYAEEVYESACLHNVLLEVNLSSLHKRFFSEKRLSDIRKMVQIVTKHNKKVIVCSDAHNIWEMGDDSNLKKIQKEIGLTDKMIINNYPKELMQLLRIDE